MRSDPNRTKAGFGLTAAAWFGVLFLNVPILFIILYCFTTDDRSYSFPPPGLTTQWFAVAFARDDLWQALWLSLRVALVAMCVALVLGTLAAAAMYRFKFFGKESVTLAHDEGVRGDTTAEKLAALKPVFRDGLVVKEGKHITAGNASQLSDGASAQVLMDRATAEKEGLPILGIYRGFQVAGCKAEEMGIGPVFAIPKLLQRSILVFREEFHPHAGRHIGRAVGGLVFFPRLQRLAVVTDTSAGLGGLRATVAKHVLAGLLVVGHDVRFAAGSFHVVERCQLVGMCLQGSLDLRPCQTPMPPSVISMISWQGFRQSLRYSRFSLPAQNCLPLLPKFLEILRS